MLGDESKIALEKKVKCPSISSLATRRAALKAHYEFDCGCARCLEEKGTALRLTARARGKDHLAASRGSRTCTTSPGAARGGRREFRFALFIVAVRKPGVVHTQSAILLVGTIQLAAAASHDWAPRTTHVAPAASARHVWARAS